MGYRGGITIFRRYFRTAILLSPNIYRLKHPYFSAGKRSDCLLVLSYLLSSPQNSRFANIHKLIFLRVTS